MSSVLCAGDVNDCNTCTGEARSHPPSITLPFSWWLVREGLDPRLSLLAQERPRRDHKDQDQRGQDKAGLHLVHRL